MDFGLIALVVLVASKVLDYVAPKTKTKVDDTVRDLTHAVLPMLPAAKARARADAPAPSMPAPPANQAGFKVRDHR